MLTYNDLNDFDRAYVDAIFFTEDCPELENKGFSDFAEETITKIVNDCAAFELANLKALRLAGDPSQNGHDFWLTRNHHGAGFWSRGYEGRIGEASIGDYLTQKAHEFGEVSLVVGDDGKLYLEG